MGYSILSAGYTPSYLSQCFNANLQFDIKLYSLYCRMPITPFSSVTEQIQECLSIAHEELGNEKKKEIILLLLTIIYSKMI